MFKQKLAYEASAGSGKTFMLVVRYLSLLFKGADPSKILALTFTNKAANEMQERIAHTLAELEVRGELDEIAKVTQMSKEAILAQKNGVLERFMRANTKIMTIDKFFGQILRKFSLYAGLMPDFTTMNAQHEIKLLNRFLLEVDVAHEMQNLIGLSLLFNKRLENIFEFLEEFYTKKSELKRFLFTPRRFEHFRAQALEEAFKIQALVLAHPKASSTAKNGVLFESFEELRSKPWIVRESMNYSTYAKCYTPELDRSLYKIQEAMLNYYRAYEASLFASLWRLLEIYERSKRVLFKEDSELSFNDVSALVFYLLQERIDREFLYFRLDAQIEHILLDEFQDTSILQYEILKPLISEIISGDGVFSEGSLFFVGDVKQSIYRFRGGVSALFHTVSKECGTDVEPLVTNYRSKGQIVEFVNRVFASKIRNYQNQRVKEGAEGGYVETITDDDPLFLACEKVSELIALGADRNEIAVLCVTNADGESIKEALIGRGVEVVTETTAKLIHQPIVRALIEYFKYIYFEKEIYKENFFALIKRKSTEIKSTNRNKRPIELAKEAIERYGLFEGEMNLIRFLEIVQNYSDLEAFLFEYERIDANAASNELEGVRVLTIHKSKGLEYEHVIVIDRLKNGNRRSSAIIYEYEGITLQGLFLRTSKRELLDKEYARAVEKERELEEIDLLNTLYVAFTRAKESLFVVAKPKGSLFEPLELRDESYGLLACEKKRERAPAIRRTPAKSFHELYYGSQLEPLAMPKRKEEDSRAVEFGIAMHYMLEMLSDFSPLKIYDAKELTRNRFGTLLDAEQIESIAQRVERLINDDEFLGLVDGRCYKEQSLIFEKELRYIDLLVELQDGSYRVIDYKSSMGDMQEHTIQVKGYVDCVEKISQKSAEGYICYLLEDGIKIVKV